jgi:long-chain acyl-CoA synthetase
MCSTVRRQGLVRIAQDVTAMQRPAAPTTLLDYFRALEAKPGTCVVYDDGLRTRRYEYAAVSRAARGFAATLAAHGVAKGDKVIIWSENRPEYLVGFWGCLLIGAVIVPIDYRASLDFLRNVRGIVGARLILAGDDVSGLSTDGEDGEVWRLAHLDWHAGGPVPDVAIDREDLTQIIFTSGATAEPKGVLIRHRNSLANIVPVEREIAKYKKYMRPVRPLRFLNLLPLSHMFGQALATSIPPMVDGTVIFMRSTNPHDIVRMVKQHRVSVLVCVPKMLDVLKVHAARIDPATATPDERRTSILARWWRYRRVHRAFGLKFWAFVVGGAPLPPALEAFWRRLGFLVIQGYGLTETAPIVTLNHPLRTSSGSVGRPIGGVEVRIAEDGEILVRGENVTSGYYGGEGHDGREGVRDAEGWFHTGDLGEQDAEGRLFIKGRKKELIVTPEGLNVYPDDVEAVLNGMAGVKESAVVGAAIGGGERVHAVLVLDPGADAEAIVRDANLKLQDHQRIRGHSVWTEGPLPRTEGTRKLKRGVVKSWVQTGERPPGQDAAADDPFLQVLGRFTGAHGDGSGPLEKLGLTSIERMEMMVALEDAFQTRLDEARFAEARTMDDIRQLVREAPEQAEIQDPVVFPSWNRHPAVGLVRRASQATWILPPIRLIARLDVKGLEHLHDLEGPVIFAANHQSHLDGPVILAAMPGRWRKQVAPAMSKEFFKAHFFPREHKWWQVLPNRLNYYLAAFFFNGFPLPQREAGARQTLRYVAEITSAGFSLLIFPEGIRTEDGTIRPFFSGVGLMASRLELPVVPIRLDGLHKVLPTGRTVPRPGPVSVTFGAPMRLTGQDYAALARQVEEAVRAL